MLPNNNNKILCTSYLFLYCDKSRTNVTFRGHDEQQKWSKMPISKELQQHEKKCEKNDEYNETSWKRDFLTTARFNHNWLMDDCDLSAAQKKRGMNKS